MGLLLEAPGRIQALVCPGSGGLLSLPGGRGLGWGACSLHRAEEMKKEGQNLGSRARWSLELPRPSLREFSGPLAPHRVGLLGRPAAPGSPAWMALGSLLVPQNTSSASLMAVNPGGLPVGGGWQYGL